MTTSRLPIFILGFSAIFCLSSFSPHRTIDRIDIKLPSVSDLIMFDDPGEADGKKVEDSTDVISRKDIRKNRRNLRRVRANKKVEAKDFMKSDNIYTRRSARRRARRVWEIDYNAQTRKIDSVRLVISDTLLSAENKKNTRVYRMPSPPVEIHEYDGVRLKLIHVNPFTYNVHLKEVHTDRINEEDLSSETMDVNAQFQISPIKIIDMKMPMAIASEIKQQETFNEIGILRAEKARLENQLDTLSWKLLEIRKPTALINAQARPIFEVPVSLKPKDNVQTEHNQNSTETLTGIKEKDTISDPIPVSQNVEQDSIAMVKSIETIQDSISNTSEVLSGKEVSLDTQFSAFLKDPVPIESDKAKLLEARNSQIFKLQNQSVELANSIDKLNEFINFHNHFVTLPTLPYHQFKEIDDARKALIASHGRPVSSLNTAIASYLKEYSRNLSIVKSTLNVIHESGLFKTSVFAFDLGAFSEQTEATAREIKAIDFNKMLQRIHEVNALINKDNFTITYESLSVSENADYLGFIVQFKQAPTVDIPKGTGSFDFKIGFLIREGVKIDLSPTLIFENGVVPGEYLFNTEGQPDGFALVSESNKTRSAMGVGLLMNVYKRSSSNFKVGGSIGFGIGEQVAPRFTLGPTLIIGRKERAIFSTGVIVGPEILPAARFNQFTDPVEVSSDLLQSGVPLESRGVVAGFYFGIGFNLFGAKNKEFFDTGLAGFGTK